MDDHQNRLGYFDISYDLLFDGDKRALGELFAPMTAERVLDMPERCCVRYYAYSPMFAPLAEGEQAPQYQLTCVKDKGEYIFSAQRV